MQFTVQLEPSRKELRAMANGRFELVRPEFWQSIEFCQFVIDRFEINKKFIELTFSLHSISDFCISKIFSRVNLLKYPINLNKSEISKCLFYWCENQYTEINSMYWEKNLSSLIEFFGTSRTIEIAKKNNVPGALLKNQLPVFASDLYILAIIQKKIKSGNIEELNDYISSNELINYWKNPNFSSVVCYLLQTISDKITQLPKEAADGIAEYCKDPHSNLEWGLQLYLQCEVKFTADLFAEILIGREIDYKKILAWYKSGIYCMSKQIVLSVDSTAAFEKLLLNYPEKFKQLKTIILDDVNKHPDEWKDYIFLATYYGRGPLFSHISKIIEKTK